MKTDRPLKNGECMIFLVVTKNRKRCRISTGITGHEDNWDNTQEQFVIIKGKSNKIRLQNEISEKLNSNIQDIKKSASQIIKELEAKDYDWTLNQFKNMYNSKKEQGLFTAYINEHIQNLIDTNHVGNANCYQQTLQIISSFDKDIDRKTFAEIDIKYINALNVWLEKRGCKGNTRKYYLKALRAIWNKAIKDKTASEFDYPFGNNGFKISELSEKTEKRYLPTMYLNKLKATKAKKDTSEYARLLFLFSYFSYGISFIDMANLTNKNIITLENGRYIVYKRQKTKHNKDASLIKIKITSQLNEIINKLNYISKPIDNYLLPIVTRSKDTEKELYDHIVGRRKKYTKYLKELANEFEFDFNLTSYVSRHTMAMQMQEKEVAEHVISQVLGHSDLRTTKTYLADLDTKVIDKAGEVL